MNAQPINGQRCRVRLRFKSLIGLSALIGFCAGVLGAPIVIVVQADKLFTGTFWLVPVAIILILAPVLGAINGAIYGALGYPLYRWITRRIDLHTYTGEFALLDNDGQREI